MEMPRIERPPHLSDQDWRLFVDFLESVYAEGEEKVLWLMGLLKTLEVDSVSADVFHRRLRAYVDCRTANASALLNPGLFRVDVEA